MGSALRVAIIFKGAHWAFNFWALRYPAFKQRVTGTRCVAQVALRDRSVARYFVFGGPKVESGAGFHEKPDITITIKNARIAGELLRPGVPRADIVNAMKNFNLEMEGPEELTAWLMETVSIMRSIGWQAGVPLPSGETRYVNGSNGGPVFVYVKDDKIVRITPIEFDDEDPQSWTIRARGKTFSPPRKTTSAPHTLLQKSIVYSKDRLLYPMKRVDFDPNGKRNTANRGKSAYVRIGWDEALDLVASEIKRAKRVHGHGAILGSYGSHHTWGNIGSYFSAFNRFMNSIGQTKMVINPDSWEGWYWGAVHHYGYSMRLGAVECYGQLEDCLQNAQMIVFWSSDPETTGGSYGAFEGTLRRMFARDIGIEMVHIDPYCNNTATLIGGKWIPVRPGTSPALAHALAYVWITEGLYDKDYVATRTTGFEAYREYLLGIDDGIKKTPEWQELETGVPAHTVRALARKWGTRKTYLAAGGKGTAFGSACRSATGSQWARALVCLMAMQGLGKPGINFGNLQYGSPIDYNFYFPGYTEGGFSGDYETTSAGIQAYQRQPQLPSINPVTQRITRNRIPEAILEGKAEGHPIDPKSIQGQFMRFHYPSPGHSKVHMMYKYGGSHFGTTMESNRLARAYQAEDLEFVVNQSIWFEGEAKFADVILPACTNYERWDIAEWAVAGAVSHHNNGQLNHRVIHMQHKCIEPLGESRSDFQIFLDLSKRLGLSAYYGEAMTELDWCRMQFEASDLPRVTDWESFLRKGYYIVPPEDPAQPKPVGLRWFAEGRTKDVPEPHPLPAGYGNKFREGLQTQSGKFEFEPTSLKMFDDPLRPPVNKYIPSWEGRSSELAARYPLQLITPHVRYSFHTHADGKDSTANDIVDHRVLKDGYYYWVARLNRKDAEQRGIGDRDLIRLFNDRGSVICCAQLTERILPGVVHSYESSAVYDPIGEPGASPDRGGCVNVLTPTRWQTDKTSASAALSCLIEVEKWGA